MDTKKKPKTVRKRVCFLGRVIFNLITLSSSSSKLLLPTSNQINFRQMMSKRTLISLLLFLIHLSAADDSAAILKVAQSFQKLPSGWSSKSSDGYCKWTGVFCDSSNRVNQIKLSNAGLSGDVPSLSDLTNLEKIYLDNNQFSKVPDGCFQGLSNLQILTLSNNPISPWPFPQELTKSSSLTLLYLDKTNLTGTLPDIFASLPNLQELRLSYNQLSGGLPDSLAKSEIQKLWINDQQSGFGFNGTLGVLSSMTSLTQVWLHGNTFTGSIPDLSKCQSLWDLSLRNNKLTGLVPASLLSLPNLGNVSLQNNILQGPIPAFHIQKSTVLPNNFCYQDLKQAGHPCDPQVTTLLHIAGGMGYPPSLAEFWKGNNPCGGSDPSWTGVTCDPQGRISLVNLANKQFSGVISPAYANLTSLKSLYLQDNNLTGKIPDSLATIDTLQNLDLSNNNLSGQVPSFKDHVKVKLTPGNPFLGTQIDTTPGSGTKPDAASGASGNHKTVIIVVSVIVSVVFLAVVFFVVYKFVVKRRNNGKFSRVKNPEIGDGGIKLGAIGGNQMNVKSGAPSELHSQSSGDQSDRRLFEGGNVAISMEVLRQVTDNFSEANILGKGGFGVVYKGELHDGTQIAVKRMESSTMGTKGLNEFQAEIAVLTKVRHRHLVALLGSCVNGHERLLVYEYMPQGTLAQRLFEWRDLGYTPLTWKQRVTIALDVARGVEYLHSLAQQSFIHRDLKPSNILIGDDMRAKVADFGLVKNAPDGKYSMETRLAGTFGYLAPEYAATGRVTTKVDVYAFGVVLMEIITGRKALDDTMPDDKCHLVTWFRRVLINKDNIVKAIDETLNPDEETLEIILRVAELAGHCTTREPQQRPDMGHAVNVLSPLVQQWKPSSQEEEESVGIDMHMSLPQALQRWQADAGTSSMYGGMSFSETQSSIPAKPSGFSGTFGSGR